MDCDEVCGCKKCNVITWWWNSWVYDEIQLESVAYQEITNNFTEEKKLIHEIEKRCEERGH